MAKKKEKEIDYIASTLDITYTIPKGLTHMLAKIGNMPEKDVWCVLSELANVCAHRLSIKDDKRGSSWAEKEFPGTGVKLRINMDKRCRYRWETKTYDDKSSYEATIKIKGSTEESFTQKQINEHITESILLGDDEVGEL
jgi:hypothetical protein